MSVRKSPNKIRRKAVAFKLSSVSGNSSLTLGSTRMRTPDDAWVFFSHFDDNGAATRNSEQMDRAKGKLLNKDADVIGVLGD